jgi:hypothetical protein
MGKAATAEGRRLAAVAASSVAARCHPGSSLDSKPCSTSRDYYGSIGPRACSTDPKSWHHPYCYGGRAQILESAQLTYPSHTTISRSRHHPRPKRR